MDGQTRCFLPAKLNQIMSNLSFSKSGECDDGCNQYTDGINSLLHFPSFWQEPSEENRYLTLKLSRYVPNYILDFKI